MTKKNVLEKLLYAYFKDLKPIEQMQMIHEMQRIFEKKWRAQLDSFKGK